MQQEEEERQTSRSSPKLPNDEIRQGLFSDMAMKGTKIEAKGPHCACRTHPHGSIDVAIGASPISMRSIVDPIHHEETDGATEESSASEEHRSVCLGQQWIAIHHCQSDELHSIRKTSTGHYPFHGYHSSSLA